MRHMEHDNDDPHGNAAVTLTALSSSMRELYRSRSSCSEFQGFTEHQFAATESGGGGHRSQTERGGGSTTSYYSQTQTLRETQETFTDASLGDGEGILQQQQQQQHQPLATQLPFSAAMTPSSSSSALNTSTLAASESTSPFSAQEDVTLRDTAIIPQGQYTPHAPGERMQTLSHMLEDRLSLASFSTERGWGNIEADLPEHSMGNAMSSRQYSRDDEQQHHEYHGRLSPSPHHGDFSAHSSQFMSERLRTPPTPSTALQREHDAIRRHQWELSHESRLRHQQQQQQQQNFHALSQNQQRPYHRQHPQEQYHHSQFSISRRDDRDSPHWTQVPPSSTMEPAVVVKPKRKYTKKSSLLPQSIIESRDQAEFQPKQRSNELLFSDRGLILKTQIPKKGRPISKHSTTSSQSTPTPASLGILPASHHYFTKTGMAVASSPSYAFSVKSGLVAAAAVISGRYPSDPALSTSHASSSQEVEHRGGIQRISPTGHRPGRPPTNPSLSRHTHSQSCSSPSLSSTSFPPPSTSRSGQSRPILSPIAPEFDLHSSVPRYTDRHSRPHGLDVTSRFSTYRDRSPTLSVATTASSSQLSYRHKHQYSDQQRSSSSSHRRYVSSPIDQEFSGEEFEHYEENEDDDDASIYPGRRRRTADNPSSTATIMSLRSFGEGVPTQMNTLKRSSSGMQKSLSMDGYHSRPVENRRRMSVGGGGGSGSVSEGQASMGAFGYGYGTANGQFEDVNEEIGSNFYDDGFDDDDAVNSQRSRKRISGSDLDYSRLVDTAGGIGGGSAQRRAVHVHQGGNSNNSGINKTRHEGVPESERRRPRSLVLPRGRGELALPWTSAMTITAAMLDSGSGSGSGSGSMVGELSGGGGQHHLDIDDDEVNYREMMIMTPAITPASQSQPLAPSGSSSRGPSTMMRGVGTRGKGRGSGAGARGRSMHSHARSLDISFTTATLSSHRDGSGGSSASHLDYQHRAAPISPSSSLEHHLSRNDTYSSEDMLPDRGGMLSSSRHRVYESSTSSLGSPPFGDTFIPTAVNECLP
ncbi:MAG: hypothetical protein J3R72DRAFT_186261 [Linnemannia gamsii]|nr:MAG: hypothetical protein J3R72DRAFT_186261 [Linnemannia gamsii]